MNLFIQALINGFLIGGVYSCIAVGLSLSYGVMRIFNWAQGETLMVAMYISIFLVRLTGMDPYVTILIAAPVMFIYGYLLQKYAINYILMRDKTREPLSILLFTAGIAYILSNLASILFTTNAISAKTKYTSTTWQIGELFISKPKVTAFIIALAVTLALQIFLQKSETGRALRSASQDREVAQLMGMDINKLYCFALGLGFACVGIASGLMTPMYSVSPALGSTFGFKSLVIVVLGGKGSVLGALLGGVIVGVVECLAGSLLSDIYAQLLIFAVFVIVLLIKPNGLLSNDRG